MIKRIIFDLDDTLIPFPDFEVGFKNIIDKYSLNINPIDLYKLIGTYENYYNIYNYESLLKILNEDLNTDLDKKFLDDFMNMYDNIDMNLEDRVIDTLKYLKSKYSLVVLTNWFTNSQKNRLRKVNILKYFDEVYGGDLVKVKPNEESFIKAMGKFKPNECVSIGDRIKIDIEPAEKLGIKTYLLGESDKYNTIKKISDLKELL